LHIVRHVLAMLRLVLLLVLVLLRLLLVLLRLLLLLLLRLRRLLRLGLVDHTDRDVIHSALRNELFDRVFCDIRRDRRRCCGLVLDDDLEAAVVRRVFRDQNASWHERQRWCMVGCIK